jgi:hypothetical protein
MRGAIPHGAGGCRTRGRDPPPGPWSQGTLNPLRPADARRGRILQGGEWGAPSRFTRAELMFEISRRGRSAQRAQRQISLDRTQHSRFRQSGQHPPAGLFRRPRGAGLRLQRLRVGWRGGVGRPSIAVGHRVVNLRFGRRPSGGRLRIGRNGRARSHRWAVGTHRLNIGCLEFIRDRRGPAFTGRVGRRRRGDVLVGLRRNARLLLVLLHVGASLGWRHQFRPRVKAPVDSGQPRWPATKSSPSVGVRRFPWAPLGTLGIWNGKNAGSFLSIGRCLTSRAGRNCDDP